MPPLSKAAKARAAAQAEGGGGVAAPGVVSGKGQEVSVRLHRRHPGQQRIADHPARFRVVMCGRRFGKSALGIRESCDVALKGEPVGWFAPSYKLALEAWRELVERLGPVTSRMNEQDKRLELVTGGVIEVWTMDGPDPARGRKYALVVIDEAGIIRDLTQIWQQSIRPTLVDLGGRALILGTPKGRRHGFVVMFNRGLGDDPDWASFRASTLDNPYIPAEEVESARKELPPEVFAQEFEGIPSDDGASVFGLDALRKAVGSVGTEPAVVYGLDLARSMDFTVLIGLDAWRRVVVLERWQSPWAVTKTKVKSLVRDVPVVGDATGVGDAIVSDLQLMGVTIYPYIFTQNSKLRLMQRLVTAFQNGEITLPIGDEHRWLGQELESMEFIYGNSGVRYEVPSGFHDDGIMSLGLAMYAWDRVIGVPPEPAHPLLIRGDDPGIMDDDGAGSREPATGDFQYQLPEGW